MKFVIAVVLAYGILFSASDAKAPSLFMMHDSAGVSSWQIPGRIAQSLPAA
jgi:hypothetical protein